MAEIKYHKLNYFKTTVPVSKSQSDIEKILNKFGLQGTRFTKYKGVGIIEFILFKNENEIMFRFKYNLPEDGIEVNIDLEKLVNKLNENMKKKLLEILIKRMPAIALIKCIEQVRDQLNLEVKIVQPVYKTKINEEVKSPLKSVQ